MVGVELSCCKREAYSEHKTLGVWTLICHKARVFFENFVTTFVFLLNLRYFTLCSSEFVLHNFVSKRIQRDERKSFEVETKSSLVISQLKADTIMQSSNLSQVFRLSDSQNRKVMKPEAPKKDIKALFTALEL